LEMFSEFPFLHEIKKINKPMAVSAIFMYKK
jgi:hypothetical protein